MWCTLLSDLEVPTLELVRHQEHGQVLVDAAQATAVYLDKLEGRGLEELLKHHPVLTLDKKLNQLLSLFQAARCKNYPTCSPDATPIPSGAKACNRKAAWLIRCQPEK